MNTTNLISNKSRILFAKLSSSCSSSNVGITTGRRAMSANAKVWIDKDTKVICQGFTGKQVRNKITIDNCCLLARLLFLFFQKSWR